MHAHPSHLSSTSRFLISKIWRTLLVAGLTFAAVQAEAARVTRVKDDQVLVDLEGSSDFTQGSRYVMIVGGKRKAVIELTKVKSGKAIGKVLKGKAVTDGTLSPMGANPGSSTASKGKKSRPRRDSDSSFADLTVGALVGFGLDSQSVTGVDPSTSATGTIDMSGTGYSLKVFADLPVTGELGAIARVGIEQFSVSGKWPNDNTEAKTDITYFSADLLARYNFLEGAFKIFPLGGLGIHYPISKKSGPLDVQKISATTVFLFGAGAQYKFSDRMYATGTLEYGLFPPSNDVKTSLIAIRGGIGWVL